MRLVLNNIRVWSLLLLILIQALGPFAHLAEHARQDKDGCCDHAVSAASDQQLLPADSDRHDCSICQSLLQYSGAGGGLSYPDEVCMVAQASTHCPISVLAAGVFDFNVAAARGPPALPAVVAG